MYNRQIRQIFEQQTCFNIKSFNSTRIPVWVLFNTYVKSLILRDYKHVTLCYKAQGHQANYYKQNLLKI